MGFFWHGEFFLDGKTKELLANLYSFQTEHDSMVTYVHPFPLESFYYCMNITIKWAVGRWCNATWGRRTGRSCW